MRPHFSRRLSTGPVWLVLLLLAGAPYRAPGEKKVKNDSPNTFIRIPLAALGYHAQGAAMVTQRLSTVSLDFIDEDHLLLTFRTTGLMKRLPDAQPGDSDQMIHAVVLEVSTGKALRSADWRMHDHGRYLWPLQNGAFLVRQRDTLYLTDATLELRPYLQSPARLEVVQPSPDGRLLVLQVDQERHTPEVHAQLLKQALDAGDGPPREDIRIAIKRTDTGAVVATTHADRPVDVPLLGEGFLDTLPAKSGHWQLRYVPFTGKTSVLGDVSSSCQPTVSSATGSLALLITCNARNSDHMVQGIDATGKIKWEFWWESSLVWPSFEGSEDGGRVAFCALRSTHPLSALEPLGEEDLKGQRVEVFDAHSGSPLLKVDVSPATAAAENFALSPEGRKLAVLAPDEVRVYPLPAPAPADTKKADASSNR